ncbi:MAG: hypothetical protein NXI31_19800 [bacterium]|nr:hypothetical protein [bacterium]
MRTDWLLATGARALVVILAFVVWSIFRPGGFSPDSIDHCREAIEGPITNLHPPLVPLVIAAWTCVGLPIGGLLLCQSIVMLLAVRSVATRAATLLGCDRASVSHSVGFGVVALLALPWSPLAIYSVTLWKDIWVGVLMLLAVDAELARRLGKSHPIGSIVRQGSIALVLPALRHNAILILPLLGYFVWASMAAHSRRVRVLVTAGVAVTSVILSLALPRLVDARDVEPANAVMALDLVGVWAEFPEHRDLMPHVDAHVDPEQVETRYRPGFVAPVLWEQPLVVRSAVLDRQKLSDDYLAVARGAPLSLLWVKARAFWGMLNWDRSYYFIFPGIFANQLEIGPNPLLPGRAFLESTYESIAASSFWRWFGAVHGVWLVLGCGLLLVATVRRPVRWLVMPMAMAIGYQATYLAATLMPDYRFLYPGTLIVQIVTLALLAAGAHRVLRRLMGTPVVHTASPTTDSP